MNLSEIDLAELDPENIGSWPKPVRSVLLVLGGIATLFLGYFFIISDEVLQWDRENQKLIEARESFSDTQKKVANLEEYKKEVTVVENELGVLTEQLPQTNEIAGLLEDISQQAAKSGLRFIGIKPLQQVTKGFYEEVPFELEMTGSFNAFGEFSGRISAMKRIVTFHDFEIVRSEDILKEESQDLVIRLVAKTYWVSGEK